MSTDVMTLRAGDLESRWVPGAGMVGASLRHRGRELLGQRGGIEAYRSRGSTFGIPLLHPWANRLAAFTYTAGGVVVALDGASPLIHTEEHGLPIHGLLAAYRGWRVLEVSEDRLVADADLGADAGIMGAFPFPHRMRLEVALAPTRLTVATTVIPAAGGPPVPIAFGFHPYFALPDVAREDVMLRHGPLRHLALDGHGIPTGESAPVPARDAPLGAQAYDDLYDDLGPEPSVTLAGGRRTITVRWLEGFTHLQLFAPPGTPTVAIEPMTAPTDALRSGDGLRLASEPFRAVFAVDVGWDA